MTNRKKVYFIISFGLGLILTTAIMVVLLFISDPEYGRSRIESIRINNPQIFDLARNIAMATSGENTRSKSSKSLPILKLELSGNDLTHLSDLYTRYLEGREGVDYYINNNVWRRASLKYKGRKYQIKFKSHGKFPDGHHEGKHYSLSIKLLDGKLINNY